MLAAHLKATIPSKLISRADPGWQQVVDALDSGDHLEAAMGKSILQPSTVEEIVAATAALISSKELEVFNQVLLGRRVLPFTVFAKHLFKAARKYHLITPNYDRLIELATEAAQVGVDSRFVGCLHGYSDPKRSADAHRESYFQGKYSLFRPCRCLCVYKPHGSMDWYDVGGTIVKCPVNIGKPPIIITPGASKYRESFRWAFDDQRAAGNRVAKAAKRFLFIGYGFNDDHLEEYLCPGLRLTKPSVIIAKDLSANAQKVINTSSGTSVLAFSAVSSTDLRTKIVTSNGDALIVDEPLWNLGDFNKGVL